MHRDGRWDPLSLIAEVTVLAGVAFWAWLRREYRRPLRPIDPVAQAAAWHKFLADQHITVEAPRRTP